MVLLAERAHGETIVPQMILVAIDLDVVEVAAAEEDVDVEVSELYI